MTTREVLLVAEQLRRPAPGGIGTYVRGLVRGLADEPDRVHATAWASQRGRTSPVPDPVAALGLPVRTAPIPSPVLTRLWDAGLVRAPRGFDVCHATSLAVPGVRKDGPPVTVFVHDLLWRAVPEAYPARGRAWHDQALGRALRRASRFLVPSSATADDLVAAGAPAAKVVVVEEGCDHLPLVPRPDGTDGAYLLSVSTLEPRKNLARLVAAYAAARERVTEALPLKVVGPRGWSGDVPGWPRGPLPDGVELLGTVDDHSLATLLAGARALLYVPLCEGFGLPAVEAMRAGTPVVASPMPSTGGAALEVDPHDTEAITQAIVAVAEDGGRRADLAAAGAARAATLTWTAAARAHADVWESFG